jgi:hypothetical protein
VRTLAGWLSHEEAEELREAVEIFEEMHEKVPYESGSWLDCQIVTFGVRLIVASISLG